MSGSAVNRLVSDPETYDDVAAEYASESDIFEALYNQTALEDLETKERVALRCTLARRNEIARNKLSAIVPEQVARRILQGGAGGEMPACTLAALRDEVEAYREAGISITVNDVVANILIHGYNPDGSNKEFLEVLDILVEDVPEDASRRCVRWLATMQASLRILGTGNRGLHWIAKDLVTLLDDPLRDAVWDADTCLSIENSLPYATHDDQKRELLSAAMHRAPDSVELNVVARWFKLLGQCVVEKWRHGEFCASPAYFVGHASLRAAESCEFLSSYRMAWTTSYKHVARACIATYAGDELSVDRGAPDHRTAARSFFAAAEVIEDENADRAVKYLSKGYRMLEGQYDKEGRSWGEREQLHKIARLATEMFARRMDIEDNDAVQTTLSIHEAFAHRARLLAAFNRDEYDTLLREHGVVRSLAESVPVHIDLDPLDKAVETGRSAMSEPAHDSAAEFDRRG